jgi:predicted phosphoribosyltransferase
MLVDRTIAGQQLAQKLAVYRHHPKGLVLALPRGGVPVASAIAHALHLPLGVHLVRKLGVPYHPELAMGAIAWQGNPVVNPDIIAQFSINKADFAQILAQERLELERRHHLYHGDRPCLPYCDRTLIVVDDGVATGATLQAALQTLQQHQPQAIIVAVPVIASGYLAKLRPQVTEVVSLLQPDALNCISQWYQDFHQLSDREVADYLRQAPALDGLTQSLS